ncbi:MAG: hypothetical protein ACUVXF_04890 [Desulfobaccales bacterium]
MLSMSSPDSTHQEVWRPSSRAFLVYYVAVAVAVFGPLINPAMGVPPWLGFLVGLAVLAGLALRKYGQEYRVTPEGLKRITFWPAAMEKLSWMDVGEIKVRRGLTQTLLNTGDVIIQDKSGAPRLCWERLADPKGVKAALEARRKAASGES